MSLRPRKVDFAEQWAFLRDCFEKTLTMEGTEGVHGADVRLAVYQLCECPDPHPFCEELYYAIKAFLEDHVRAVAAELALSEARSEPLLGRFLQQWDVYAVGTAAIESLVHFLDTTWVKDTVLGCPNPLLVDGLSPLLLEELGEDLFGPNESKKQDVFFFAQLCINTWSELLFEGIAEKLTSEVLCCISSDRKGEGSFHTLVTHYRDALLALTQANAPLKTYRRWLEEPYIDEMSAFYRVEASNFIMENGILNYLHKCQSRLEDEELRASKYLDSSSQAAVRAASEEVLIAKNAAKIHGELRWILEHEQVEHIGRAHELLGRIASLEPLQREWRRFVVAYGSKRLQALLATAQTEGEGNASKRRAKAAGVEAMQYVESLIEIYSHVTELVHRALAGSVEFRCIMDKACMDLMRTNCVVEQEKAGTHFSAQQLAGYLDALLRGSKAKVMTDGEQEAQVEHCIALFKLVEDKDVFRKHYANKLAVRLIDGVSASDYLEQLVLTSLHNACGFDYVSKLRKMVQDVKLAADCNERFRAYLASRARPPSGREAAQEELVAAGEYEPALGLSFSALVLTTASWPLVEQRQNVILPPELSACVAAFTRFYNKEHSGRKLVWLHNHSKGDIALHGFKKPHVISMSTYFMTVLLLFNDQDCLSYAELKAKTNLTDADLQYCLPKLTKCHLLVTLRKDGGTCEGSKLTKSSVFAVNDAFAFKSVRFKIASRGPQQASAAVAIDTRIDQDRVLYLQAAIVRVMKHRKQLTHEALIVEVLSQSTLGFKPSVPAIKRCVEKLIEKEYLERLPDSSSTYRYLA